MTAPIDSGYVADFMELILAKVVETFTSAGVSLPARRFVTFGTPAADTEQVTVALQQIYLGTPGTPPTQPMKCNSQTTAVVRVEILREVPVPQDRKIMVTAERMQAAGIETITDAELLLQAVNQMCSGSQDTPAMPNLGMFADVSLPAESGALGGPILTLTIGVF